MSLKDRVIVITGATGGLGRVAARAFAEQGARLALLSTSALKLEQLAASLSLPEDRVAFWPFDLRESRSAEAAAANVQLRYGRVDALIHLVGGWVGGVTLSGADPADLESMLEQHVWTTFHLARAFVPPLIANGWGRIIVVSSPSAQKPRARGGIYAAAKAAEENLILTLAQELKDTGVTANILQVSTIDVQHERDQTGAADKRNWSTPEEISAAMLYLCSGEAQIVSGARIPLFGPG